jgi:sensor c-di-GMP phosphodiesterase-like protein
MPDLLVSKVTAMKPAEVMVRAGRFFTAQKWRVKSQDGYIATFVGVPGLNRMHRVMLVLLTLCLIFPGVLYYFLEVRGSRREQSITVSLKPQAERCEVVVTYPPGNNDLIIAFLSDLV